MCIKREELDSKVEEIRSLKALKEETEIILRTLEKDIIEFMTETEQLEIIGKDFKATYKMQRREMLDKAMLQAFLGDLADYTKVSTFGVLRIK